MDEITNAVTVTPEVPQNSTMPLDNINQGTVAIEASRAIAEAQGKLVIAKRFPRNEIQAFANMKKACQRTGLANKAFYSYPRGNETVSGPTIRLAEELARCWGNIDFGIKELSQDNGKSEMQAYAWDLETNTMSVQNFTNPHAKEVRGKIKTLTSLRDMRITPIWQAAGSEQGYLRYFLRTLWKRLSPNAEKLLQARIIFLLRTV